MYELGRDAHPRKVVQQVAQGYGARRILGPSRASTIVGQRDLMHKQRPELLAMQ
jgi:hypothetical protein